MVQGRMRVAIATLAIASSGGCNGGASAKAEPVPARPGDSALGAVPGRDASGRVAASRAGQDKVGSPAPPWGAVAWAQGGPVALADLRGKVVLIRFWTDTCPFCRATAPALAQLDDTYRERGLAVIGMYHPKPRGTDRPVAGVLEFAKEHGWSFPVALDNDWRVLDDYWSADDGRRYTSVSFVADKRGTIRYVHPGPEFHSGGPADHEQCRSDYNDIAATIEALLAEREPA